MKKLLTLPLVTFFVLVAVFFVGAFSHAAAPGITKAHSNSSQSVTVTFYTDQGTMADGWQTHVGACAARVTQFAFGTEIRLSNTNNQFSCTIEDTGTNVCQDHIDVALPGQVDRAVQLGVQNMKLEVVGFDHHVAQEAAANHPASSGC